MCQNPEFMIYFPLSQGSEYKHQYQTEPQLHYQEIDSHSTFYIPEQQNSQRHGDLGSVVSTGGGGLETSRAATRGTTEIGDQNISYEDSSSNFSQSTPTPETSGNFGETYTRYRVYKLLEDDCDDPTEISDANESPDEDSELSDNDKEVADTMVEKIEDRNVVLKGFDRHFKDSSSFLDGYVSFLRNMIKEIELVDSTDDEDDEGEQQDRESSSTKVGVGRSCSTDDVKNTATVQENDNPITKNNEMDANTSPKKRKIYESDGSDLGAPITVKHSQGEGQKKRRIKRKKPSTNSKSQRHSL
ncbi:hypothetical protein DASC09_026580 [Saccharomycopsis crataegensis]|uniref:Uncharacterized protein n=1 Tax=Saccharomycopsis crataegensis TaxID=43959 RepID=A0AAV5QKL3_9ASCO|nr:hypothetical protein DASC09_026580 [Saccharomycopsis crataegensis]